jgi:hypothetical protein
MHVAVRRYAVDPDLFSDLKERLDADFIPQLKGVDGFISYYAVASGPETLDTISVFETRDGERKSTELAMDFVNRNYPNKRVERVTLDEGPCIAEYHARVPA